MENYNKIISNTDFEIHINTTIYNARKMFRERVLKFSEIKDDAVKKVLQEESIKDLLNAYELACGVYLDKAIDEKMFRTLRKREIISLFEQDIHNGIKTCYVLHTNPNPYPNLEKVYNSFKNTENGKL